MIAITFALGAFIFLAAGLSWMINKMMTCSSWAFGFILVVLMGVGIGIMISHPEGFNDYIADMVKNPW